MVYLVLCQADIQLIGCNSILVYLGIFHSISVPVMKHKIEAKTYR